MCLPSCVRLDDHAVCNGRGPIWIAEVAALAGPAELAENKLNAGVRIERQQASWPGHRLGTLAVSECLRGSAVRWDGDHNGEVWPRRVVERLFDLIGLCPEVGIGLGVPRPPIRLTGAASSPRAVVMESVPREITAQLQHYAGSVAGTLAQVDGYVFADRSPSCGLASVKVHAADGRYRRQGRGVYAAAVLRAQPALPAVDAECLWDEATLLDFVCAVTAYRAARTSTGDDGDAANRRTRIARLLTDMRHG